jgi:CRP-like cAMP-binding protein
MAGLEEPPVRGQAVQIYSRSSGGWIGATVQAVDGEEATVVYGGVDGRETSKVVDWDDPEQLLAGGGGGGGVAEVAQHTTWAASSGKVFDPDEDYAGDQIINPLGADSPNGTPNAAKSNGVANGIGHVHDGDEAAGVGGKQAAGAPAPSPEAIFQQKPQDSADTNALLMWMKDMIENQHKDIAELRETVATSVAAGGGAALSLMAAGGLTPADIANVDSKPVSREVLIEFIHKNPVFAAATGINPVEKGGFIESIAGRLERRFFYKDSMVIRKGTQASEMYFLYKGVAEVFLEHPDTAADSNIPPVAKLKSGLFFGEAALLADTPEQRNAWIRAQCDMEVYVLTAADLKQSLADHPSMAILFNNEKHRRAQQREEHFERFKDGGGNFKKGFKVRLRTLGKKEQLAAEVAKELQEAFETVPEVFPRSVVETLLLDKMERVESLRDQLAATGTTEQEHGHGGAMKPPTPKEKNKLQMQMTVLAIFFFILTFVPFVSEQHHSGKSPRRALGPRARLSLTPLGPTRER